MLMHTWQAISSLEIYVPQLHLTVELESQLMDHVLHHMDHVLHLLDPGLVPRVLVPVHRLLVLLAIILLCVNKVGLLAAQQITQNREVEVILDFLL